MNDQQRRKKLIEVSLPLEAINKASAHEKMPGIGPHPRGLHMWWARRPLAACRAIIFSQLVDDPSAWPDRFPSEDQQKRERERLHGVIEAMVPWSASTNEHILNNARWEIARSIAWSRGQEPPDRSNPSGVISYLHENAPPIYDPFCGGGSIPLEAQRLGLRAIGSDLNPVPVLISKALIEIPPKFAGRPPVNPDCDPHKVWHSAEGLVEDIRYYGNWMYDEACQRVGSAYPDAILEDGSTAGVIAWIWARTIASPDPLLKGAHVPLISTFLLSTKKNNLAWLEIVLDENAQDGWRFEVRNGQLSKERVKQLKAGTKSGRGANFVCVLSGAPIESIYTKRELKAGRVRYRQMAVVAEGERGRIYLGPSEHHENAAAVNLPEIPELEHNLPENPRWFSPPGYGMPRYVDLFSPRQLRTLVTLSDLVSEARTKVLEDCTESDHLVDEEPLCTGGNGAGAYADAIATYLSFAVDRTVDFNTTMTRWNASNEKVMNTLARQAIPMNWDFGEAAILSDVVGGFAPAVDFISKCLLKVSPVAVGQIEQINAPDNSYPVSPSVISTDPPYYDNIGYADLSDFFYVWLRRSLRSVWPDQFRRVLSPKAEELVANTLSAWRESRRGASLSCRDVAGSACNAQCQF